MARWLVGIVAFLLLGVGTFMALLGRAEEVASAPEPRLASASPGPISPTPNAPEADPINKEQKRFARTDKDEDGRITLAEMVEPRRKAFAKLDANSDGTLSFEEWAKRAIDKFDSADADKSKWLDRSEYATTAPKRRPKKPGCACV